MIGWIILFVTVGLTGYGFWRWSGLGRDFLAPFATVLTFAVAGYVWSGSPGLSGQPAKAATPSAGVTESLIETRLEFQQSEFDAPGNWIVISDGLMRAGKLDQAVGALRRGIELYPDNADIWTAMGAALLRESNGRMTIPALYAFNQARRLAPNHAGPDFFTGIAKIEDGDFSGARATWASLLSRAPKDAKWRPGLEKRISLLDQAIAVESSARRDPTQ